MQSENPFIARNGTPPIGRDQLAEGLMLLRASTLKMIRLQLAMERHDRRVALEAVDELVALDRRLQDYIADVDGADEQLLFRNELDAERAMLNREKLTLAAEVIFRVPEPDLEERAAADDWLGPPGLLVDEEEAPRRRRWRLAVAIPAIATGIAASAYALLPDAQDWLAQAAGALG